MRVVLVAKPLLFLAVRGPRELVEAVVEVVCHVGAGLAPGFVGWEEGVGFKGDGLDGGAVVGWVCCEVEFGG